jgi:hypothetical protein
MKTGIMQPYLFPYIGYFQLVHAVDTFVIYDDVQYITRGWIHRNRFLQNGKENLFTFSLQNDSSRKNINERYFTTDFENERDDFLKMLQFAYGQAPHYDETRALAERVFEKMDPQNIEENIALKIGRSIEEIARFLGLETTFLVSSELDKDNSASGQELILDINRVLGSDCYINPVNGQKLYSHEKFEREGFDLYFIKPEEVRYEQFSNDFIPWLSMIDVCMFNDRESIKGLLKEYSLVQ